MHPRSNLVIWSCASVLIRRLMCVPHVSQVFCLFMTSWINSFLSLSTEHCDLATMCECAVQVIQEQRCKKRAEIPGKLLFFCQHIPKRGSNLQAGMWSFSFRPLSAGSGTDTVIGSFTCSSEPSLANRWTEMAATGVSSNFFSVPVREAGER